MADAYERVGTELAVLVPSIWSKNYYDALLAELPFNSIVSRDYEGEISAIGDRVKIATFPEFSAAAEIAEDASNFADAVTVTSQSLVIDKRIVKDFIITNLALTQSLPAMQKLQDLAIHAIQKRMQALIIAAIVPNAAAPDHSIAYTSGTTLALADILASKRLLDAQDVPMENRHMVVGASQLNDLFNITGLVSTDFGASNAPLLNGNLPSQILGYMPHFTSLVSSTSYFFHSSFMTVAAQEGMNVKQFDKGIDGSRSMRINCDTLFGLKQLSGLRVVTIA